MEDTLAKSLSFVVFILIGIILKSKFTNAGEVNGLKKIILTIALPATIFIALLKIKIDATWLLLPVIVLGLNGILYLCTPLILSLLGIDKSSPKAKTAALLFPSLAPGLSCFPFILEFLGDTYLAKAAMADLGNKFFVLFILYLVAIRWHYQNQPSTQRSTLTKLQNLLKTMITEPVNLFIVAALLLVIFGFNIEDLPVFINDTLSRLSLLMTPLVLLFIGLAVKLNGQQFLQIFSLLLMRGSLVIFLAVLYFTLAGVTASSEMLLVLAFSMSAVSFWPFAHIATIHSKEENLPPAKKTFDLDFGISMLAFSLPLSVGLILGMFSTQEIILANNNLFLLALFLFGLALLPNLIIKIKELISTAGKAPSAHTSPSESLDKL